MFVPDETVAPAGGILHGKVYLDGDTWVMLFVPALQKYQFAGVILRATAPDPTGPWTVTPEPVLTAGSVLEWDSGGLFMHSFLPTDDGYALYYHPFRSGIGMATSPDGIAWTKYDDPTTTNTLYANSDPVFLDSEDSQAWDSWYISGSMVRRTEDGWEMLLAVRIQTYTQQRGLRHQRGRNHLDTPGRDTGLRQRRRLRAGHRLSWSMTPTTSTTTTWSITHGCVGLATGTTHPRIAPPCNRGWASVTDARPACMFRSTERKTQEGA